MKKDKKDKQDSNNELNELMEELKVLKTNLENHISRRDGGIIRIGGNSREVISIDKELEIIGTEKEMAEIECNFAIPITPYWVFETKPKWQELSQLKRRWMLDDITKRYNRVMEQKEKILREIPEFQQKIHVLEGKIEELQVKSDVKVNPA